MPWWEERCWAAGDKTSASCWYLPWWGMRHSLGCHFACQQGSHLLNWDSVLSIRDFLWEMKRCHQGRISTCGLSCAGEELESHQLQKKNGFSSPRHRGDTGCCWQGGHEAMWSWARWQLKLLLFSWGHTGVPVCPFGGEKERKKGCKIMLTFRCVE